MKVIHIISSFAAGGAETYVKNLLIGLNRSGCEPVLYGMDQAFEADPSRFRFQQRFIADLEAGGIEWGLIGSRARRDPIFAVRRFSEIIKTVEPHLIHAHLTLAAVYAGLAARTAPMIFTHHRTPVRRPLTQKLFLRRRIARYIAVSSSGQTCLIEQAGIKPERISLIYNGIDLSDVNAHDHPRPDTSHPVIISVGNLRKEKNYPLMFKAMEGLCAICRQNGVRPPLLKIAGDGLQRDRLQRMVRDLNLDQHVEFLGLRDDVSRLLRMADIFCMSSSTEGLSIALIEALASGLPIVATDVGGNREIVEDNACGFLTRPGDAGDLADRLWRLIRDPELRMRFSRHARRRAERFSLDRSIRMHHDIYRDILRTTTSSAIDTC